MKKGGLQGADQGGSARGSRLARILLASRGPDGSKQAQGKNPGGQGALAGQVRERQDHRMSLSPLQPVPVNTCFSEETLGGTSWRIYS